MPRQTSLLRYLFSRWAGWFAVYGLVLALIGVVTLANAVRDTLRLKQEAEQTLANVLALEVNGIRDSKRFNVRFAFLHDGVWYENSADVPEEVFSGLQVEDRIAVRYWRQDPGLVRLNAVPDPTVLFLILTWGGFSLFSLVWTYGVLRAPSQAFWLSRNGIALRAKVTRAEKAEDEGKSESYRAVWIEPGGRTGKTSAHPASKLPPVGSLITILKDPTGKRPSVWEGDI
jgi:hypothetical protein